MDAKKHFLGVYNGISELVPEDLELTIDSKKIFFNFLQLLPYKKSRIVDFGCGRGEVLFYLETLGYNDLYGIDMCNVIFNKLLKHTKFVEGNVVRSGFEAAYFDGLLSNQTIEHCDEKLFLEEISRVLKPGGYALVTSVLRDKGAWYFYKNSKGERVIEPTHLKEYVSEQEYKNIFLDKFEILGIETSQCKSMVFDDFFRMLFKLTKFDLFKKIRSQYLFVRILRKIKIPIWGYHTIAILLKKREALNYGPKDLLG